MEIKVVTKNTATVIRHLINRKKLVFTVEDIEGIIQDTSRAYLQEFLQSMVERQLAFRLKRGLYILVPYYVLVDDFVPNPYVTASALASNHEHYLGFLSALKIHSLVTDPLLTHQVVAKKQIFPKQQVIQGLDFQFICFGVKRFFGIESTWVEYLNQILEVKCSNLERTIVDILYRPEYVGGISVVAKALVRAHHNLDYFKLMGYIQTMGTQSVIKRLGYLLELLEIEFPIFSQLQEKKSDSYVLLDPSRPKKGKFLSRWSIQLNITEEQIKKGTK